MKVYRCVRLVLVMFALTSSACGGSSSNSSGNPPVVGSCTAIPFFSLSYPASGTSGVSPQTNTFVLGAPAVNLASYQLQLVTSSGQVVMGSSLGAAPSPLPSPIAPLLPGLSYAGASASGLSNATSYQVRLFNASAASCAQYINAGTFSTQ